MMIQLRAKIEREFEKLNLDGRLKSRGVC